MHEHAGNLLLCQQIMYFPANTKKSLVFTGYTCIHVNLYRNFHAPWYEDLDRKVHFWKPETASPWQHFFFLLKLLALFIGVLPITRIKSNSRNGHTAVVVLDVFAVVVVSSFPGSPRWRHQNVGSNVVMLQMPEVINPLLKAQSVADMQRLSGIDVLQEVFVG